MILAGGDEVSGAPSGGPVSFSQSPRFPGRSNLELCLLFSQIPDSRTCPASRLERDMELVPHTLKQRKSLVVTRRNKTCLVTCHFNENTNLSQVSVPPTPLPFLLPPRSVGSQATGGAGRKTENKPCSFREHRSSCKHLRTQGSSLEGKSIVNLFCKGDKICSETVLHSAASLRKTAWQLSVS